MVDYNDEAQAKHHRIPAFDEVGTAEEEAAFDARAERILVEGLTKGERRALLRKIWQLRGRPGGEVLLAQRMVGRGLMTHSSDPDARKVVRSRIGQHVLKKLSPA